MNEPCPPNQGGYRLLATWRLCVEEAAIPIKVNQGKSRLIKVNLTKKIPPSPQMAKKSPHRLAPIQPAPRPPSRPPSRPPELRPPERRWKLRPPERRRKSCPIVHNRVIFCAICALSRPFHRPLWSLPVPWVPCPFIKLNQTSSNLIQPMNPTLPPPRCARVQNPLVWPGRGLGRRSHEADGQECNDPPPHLGGCEGAHLATTTRRYAYSLAPPSGERARERGSFPPMVVMPRCARCEAASEFGLCSRAVQP